MKLFETDNTAFYPKQNGDLGCRSVKNKYDKTRNNKSKEQAKLEATPLKEVIGYANDLLERLKLDNGVNKENIRAKITLDNIEHSILGNGIIVKDCKWTPPVYDKIKSEYIYHDSKYDAIKDEFELQKPNDIVWLKFTKTGHVGVVAQSFDINFSNDIASGKLVEEVTYEWDESLVLIFPLTTDILGEHQCKDIETAIGNYLISKGVPIIDYYSHNY